MTLVGCSGTISRRWRAAWLRLLLAFMLLQLTRPILLRAQFLLVTNGEAIGIAGYTGPGGVVTIPRSTNGLPVTRILSHAFTNHPALISVAIPSSVTNCAVYAFLNCPNLLAVYFEGDSPIDFFPGAAPVFWGVPKTTLYRLPETRGWGTVFDSLPVVEWNPQVLTQLLYSSSADQISVTGYAGPGGAVVIPSTVDGLPVTGISSNSFLNLTSLTGIIVPDTVTNIGDSAFAGCTGLTDIRVPPGITGHGVFSDCTALTNILIPNSATRIRELEFAGCTALSVVTMPDSITNFGARAFLNCSSLNAVYFQGNAPVADATAYDGAINVTNYYLPRTSGWGTTLGGRPIVPILFTQATNNGTITIAGYIGLGGFVVIPARITGLPVTTLGNAAFARCSTLTNIIIGTNITAIAGQAFVGCTNLLAISVDTLNPVFSSLDGVLFNKNQSTLVSCPGGRTGSYRVPDSASAIATYGFQWCLKLTSVAIPASVTSIGGLAFDRCASLKSVFFQGNAPASGYNLFYEDADVTVYHLSETTGWQGDYQGAPTVVWNPLARTDDGSFGVRSNQFGFNITGMANIPILVEAATNLAQPAWTPLQTGTLTNGSLYIHDAQWTNYPGRFYRIRWP